MPTFHIKNYGSRDLEFEGTELGSGYWEKGPGLNNVTVVVYRTKSDKEGMPQFVVAATMERGGETSQIATITVGAKGVLNTLKVDGKLGKASKLAWESACQADSHLKSELYERL